MPERRDPPPTDEGWYALHDFRTIDWDAWREATDRDRTRALEEVTDHLQSTLAVEDAEEGGSALYSILGHKADLLVVHLRPSTADISALERQFELTEFAEYTERTTSFVSVTEASGYSERARDYFEGELDEDSGLFQYIQSRLEPTIPDATHVCFYPMDKRRQPEQNWYDLSFEERAEHMAVHGEIGREYGGRVTQMITGAIALDDWEWGVTLWGDDPADMKDLLYEMRFDPSTSQYADFGSFYIGRRMGPEDLPALLAGEQVPTDGDHAQDEVHSEHPSETTAAEPATPASSQATTSGETHETDAASDHGTTTESSAMDTGESAHGNGQTASDTAPDSGVHTESSDAQSDGASGARPPHSSHTHSEEGSTAHTDSDSHGHAETARGSSEKAAEDDSGDSRVPSGVAPGGGSDTVEKEEDEDITTRLATLGLHRGSNYEGGDYGIVLYSDADAQELATEVADLRENFEHYDSHITTAVRAQGGRSAVASIWDSQRAADTAEGFLTDLPEVAEVARGPLASDSEDEGTVETTTAESDAEIQEELAELDVYAGQPHGEDIYALVLYSQADSEQLQNDVAEMRVGFNRYDTHEGTSVYEDPDSETSAVVSLWATEDAADTASDHITELPGIVGWADDTEGFGTMGMFYKIKPQHREDFIEKFDTVGELLDGMEGHRETALLINTEEENDMFIASQWDSKEDAMSFFRSDEFTETVDWGRDILDGKPRHVFLA